MRKHLEDPTETGATSGSKTESVRKGVASGSAENANPRANIVLSGEGDEKANGLAYGITQRVLRANDSPRAAAVGRQLGRDDALMRGAQEHSHSAKITVRRLPVRTSNASVHQSTFCALC